MLKGTHAALPPSSAVFLRWRSLGRYCATSFRRVAHDKQSTISRIRPASRRTGEYTSPDLQTQVDIPMAARVPVAVHG